MKSCDIDLSKACRRIFPESTSKRLGAANQAIAPLSCWHYQIKHRATLCARRKYQNGAANHFDKIGDSCRHYEGNGGRLARTCAALRRECRKIMLSATRSQRNISLCAASAVLKEACPLRGITAARRNAERGGVAAICRVAWPRNHFDKPAAARRIGGNIRKGNLATLIGVADRRRTARVTLRPS